MPFTFTHPGVALFFRRNRYVSPWLIAAGSVAPDLHYFVSILPHSLWRESHTIRGLFTVSLPLGLASAGLVFALREELSTLSGIQSTSQTLGRLGSPKAERFALVCANIVLGAITHLVLDSFTHRYGYVVGKSQFLSDYKIHDMALYSLLQLALSCTLGLLLLGAWIKTLQKTNSTGLIRFFADTDRRRALSLMGTGALLADLYWWYSARLPFAPTTFAYVHFPLMTFFTNGAIIGLLTQILWMRSRRK